MKNSPCVCMCVRVCVCGNQQQCVGDGNHKQNPY